MRAHNSTIKVKQKICKRCGRQKFIFSKGRCQECAKIEGVAKDDEKEQQIEFATIVADLDAVFSRYIRHKYADKDGLVKCYTCPAIEPIAMIENGHYISRSHMYLRWDERNNRPQCSVCNNLKHGNIAVYTANLEKEHPGLPDILMEESRMVYKWSREELKSLIGEYSRKLKQLHK
jgi:Bacteriophage Lambda NinG protein